VRKARGAGSSSKASQTLRSRSSRHRDDRLLSCGSPGLRRLKHVRRAVWVELSLFAVAPVFRCSALRSSDRPAARPTRKSCVLPSLSSGATAEYHRSRQSHDSSVRSLARPTLSDPHRREASDRRPHLADRPLDKRERGFRSQGPERRHGAVSVHRARPPKRSTHREPTAEVTVEPQGPEPDRPSEHPRPKPERSLPSPLKSAMASHRRHTREPAAGCLS